LPAQSKISVEFLYVKNWEDEEKFLTDRIEVGIWLSSSANEVHSVRLSGSHYTFDKEVSLLAVFPNPSIFGTGDVEDLRVDIVHTDGYIEPILVIERFRTEWREKYVFVEPIGFPLGAELRVSQPIVWVDFVTQ